MSCEAYVRKRAVYEVGFGSQKKQDDEPKFQFQDDEELLAYLMDQEHLAEQSAVVSYDSPTSD